MTGGLTDLDRRGGKPLVIKEGDEALGEVKSESIKPDKSKTSIGLTREDFKSDEDFEFYQNNFEPFQSIKPDQSKTNELVSQNMLAPPEEEDDVITLPPISSGGDDEPIETTPSPFGSSDSQSDQITGTESGIPFIDVISNPFLSVV